MFASAGVADGLASVPYCAEPLVKNAAAQLLKLKTHLGQIYMRLTNVLGYFGVVWEAVEGKQLKGSS